MIITDIGLDAALQSQASGFSYKISLNTIKFGAQNNSMGRGATDLPGGVIYTALPSQVKYAKIDNSIIYQVTLDQTIGDFTYGSVGLYMDSGELFAYDVFPLYTKYANNLPERLGNVNVRYYTLSMEDISSMVELTIDHSMSASLPSVINDAALPDANNAPHEVYVVHAVTDLGGEAGLAYTDGTDWHYLSFSESALSAVKQSNTFTATPSATGENSIAIGEAQVSGDYSVAINGRIVGDYNFVASTGNSVTTQGTNNIAIGDRNSAGNTSDRNHNTIIGGVLNTSTGNFNTALGADGADMQSDNGLAFGRHPKTSTNSEIARSAGMFSRKGDAQGSSLLFKGQSSSLSATEILINNQKWYIEENSVTQVKGVLMSYNTTMTTLPGDPPTPQAGMMYAWDVTFGIYAAQTKIAVSGIFVTPRAEFASPQVTILSTTLDLVNRYLRLFVNPQSSSNTLWVFDVQTTRIMW